MAGQAYCPELSDIYMHHKVLSRPEALSLPRWAPHPKSDASMTKVTDRCRGAKGTSGTPLNIALGSFYQDREPRTKGGTVSTESNWYLLGV